MVFMVRFFATRCFWGSHGTWTEMTEETGHTEIIYDILTGTQILAAQEGEISAAAMSWRLEDTTIHWFFVVDVLMLFHFFLYFQGLFMFISYMNCWRALVCSLPLTGLKWAYPAKWLLSIVVEVYLIYSSHQGRNFWGVFEEISLHLQLSPKDVWTPLCFIVQKRAFFLNLIFTNWVTTLTQSLGDAAQHEFTPRIEWLRDKNTSKWVLLWDPFKWVTSIHQHRFVASFTQVSSVKNLQVRKLYWDETKLCIGGNEPALGIQPSNNSSQFANYKRIP